MAAAGSVPSGFQHLPTGEPEARQRRIGTISVKENDR